MAASLVGGALLSSFLNVVFDRLSSPEVVNWIRGKKLDQRLLQRLETSLCVVQAVLNDAEQKQITDPAVKKWLTNLEDAVYVADDLLDEIHTKAAVTLKHPGNFLSRYCKFNLQDRRMLAKIERVIDTLEHIAKHKDILGLKNISAEDMSWRIPSTSLVEKSDIYGRDDDKEAIIKLVLDDTSDAKISVIPIVGMGGVGKTTLAQLVYNDDKLKENFDFKAWVCVGENFDVLKMTKTILETGNSNSCNLNDLNSIQLKLKNMLTGKRFLIVLDDMWNERYGDWENFQNPFQYGSEGSKILVTTRNDNVADVIQTMHPYKLSLLSDEHCWSVFAKHASLSPDFRDYSSLEEVGRKIVEKCKGLPLAAQTLGALLRTKDNVRDWKDVLNSEIWEFSENESRILPALRISYHYLPSYLKHCFVFCSLYSKDYQFDRDELILLWMANDLLQSSKSCSTLEKIGYKHFNDLASRSFFQPSNIDERLFVMHDLMHDLAIFYAGDFYFGASELGSAAKVDIKTRHLSFDAKGNYSVSEFLKACDSLKCVRTLLQFNLSAGFSLSSREIALNISILQLKCIRVLSFVDFPLHSLPDSIGELIHLRYLDLSGSFIVILPESLSKLHNLQTLKLRYCNGLNMLPSNMKDLVNLRHLDIRGTDLQEMPIGMSNLKALHFLSYYIVGGCDENGIKELGALANLHGSLAIHKLENVLNSGEASEERMIDKLHIDDLEFNWSPRYIIAADFQIEKDILDKLQPCTELKVLKIVCYMGEILSDWLGHSSYHSMTTLTLRKCWNCCKLPSLGQLPSLKRLEISCFDKLTSIGAEFYKNDEFCQETPFPSLETLELGKLSTWQLWHSAQFGGAFPRLKKLSISDCPMLRGDLPHQLPSLEKLSIYGCEQLTCSLPCAPCMLKLDIRGVSEVRFQELTSLRSLSISECSSAISFPGACIPASLQYLVICDCRNLEFPMQQQRQQEWLHRLEIYYSCDSLISFPLAAFPNLTGLVIEGCDNMKCLEVSQSKDAAPLPPSLELRIDSCPSFVSLLSQSSRNNNAALPSLGRLTITECHSFLSFSTLGKVVPQLARLNIQDCPEIEIDLFDEEEGDGCLLPTLRELCIERCEKLVRCLASSTVLHSCRSLIRLEIDGACDSVKSFPGEGCLPASLKILELWYFPSLETLDCKGLLHLTSLQLLSIEACRKLENIVGEKMPASLKTLIISRSPLLGERCRDKDPAIWPKISHIPRIQVDGRRIHDLTSSSDVDTYTNAKDTTNSDREGRKTNATDTTNSDTEGRKGQTLGCKGYFKCLRM